MASFLHCSPYSYCSSNYSDSNSCCSLGLLKALAKSNGNLFAIASKSEKSDNYCYCDSWKNDNYKETNTEKSIQYSTIHSYPESKMYILSFDF